MTLLDKIFSKEAAARAVEIVKSLPRATTEQEATANHEEATRQLYAFVEAVDQDIVRPIPYAGPFLAVIVDTPPVDALELRACAMVIEQTYRALKYGGAL